MFTLTTGYDNQVIATLKKEINGLLNTFNIPNTATVKAAVISMDNRKKLSSTVIADNAAAGADWLNSLVVIDFTAADLTGIDPGDCKIEIQVDDDGKTPFFVEGDAVKGLIDS